MVRVKRHRRKVHGTRLNGRSRITNGTTLLPSVDGRSLWARRLRDLVEQHTADLGGESNLSQAEASIVRHIAVLSVELEHLAVLFHNNGSATPAQLMLYGRTANTLVRACKVLGLKRRAKNVTPSVDEYLRRSRHKQIDVEAG